jgi:RNA polymerase sigma factor (sigma-70 family)
MKNFENIKTHPDQLYIEALLNNDPALLNELYRKYSGKIKRMVEQNNGNEDDAADIFQDALLSIYNKAKNNNFTLTCPLDAFLYLICKNKWITELNKRRSHRVTFTDTEGYNLSEDLVKLAEICNLDQARKKLLEEKLETLGDSCKKLLPLSWSGHSMDKVAQMLYMTYGYARKKKSECMGKLIQLVQQSPEFKSLKW